MLIFIACIIPVFTAFVLWYFFRHKTVWWEFLIPFAASIIIGLAFKFGGEYAQTRDTEYWSGTIVKAEYYEDWNEYIHQTCTCCCDKDGNNCSTYDCSYVDYHPAYWEITDNNGITTTVSKEVYKKLRKKFGNSKKVDLRRDYHTNDGDKYVTYWPKTDKTLECMVTEHTYENRIQASTDIHNYQDVSEDDIKLYKLYDYPKIHSYYKQDNILGKIDGWSKYNRKLEILNAKLGKKKQVKVFVLLFDSPDRQAGIMQEAYWKGGNKNEVVVCIGLDENGSVDWCHPFSWTEEEIVLVDIRTEIEETEGKLDMGRTIDFIYNEVDQKFVRKEFADFNYITVPPTSAQIIWTIVLTLLINVGISFWLIRNEFDEDNPRGNKSRYRSFRRNRWRY